MNEMQITVCPSCGSEKLEKVCRDWVGSFEGWSYAVPSLEFYECPACGEKDKWWGKPPPYRERRDIQIRSKRIAMLRALCRTISERNSRADTTSSRS